MSDYVLDDEIIDALSEDQKHRELMSAFGRMINALEEKKEDAINTELQDVLNKNKELITGFIGKIKEIQKPDAPEVNVDINQKEVITSVEQMEKNIVEALGSLEKQVKLSMERKPLKVEFVIVDRTSVGFASRIIAKEL